MVVLNVAVFVAMVANGVSALSPTSASLIQWGADYGPRTTGGQSWRLLTNTFVHIGVPHIAMNMIALWQSGRTVERLLGNLGFAVTYLLAGLGGSLVSTLSHPFTVSAGASGAIFGIYGALIAYLLRHRGQIPREILSSLQKTAVVFVGLNLVLGMQQKGIDMAAHLGGLGGGLLAGLFVGRPVTEDRRIARKHAIVVGALGLALVALAARALPRKADLAEEVAAFQIVEKNAVAAYNQGVDLRDRRGDEALARIIDEKVLPPWRAFHRRLAPVDALAPAQQPLGRELAIYMEARAQAWSRTSTALRHHNREAIAAANADLRDVLDSLRILNGKEEPASEADSSPAPSPRADRPRRRTRARLRRSLHLDVDLAGLGLGALRQRHRQDASVVARLDVVCVDRNVDREGAPQLPTGALGQQVGLAFLVAWPALGLDGEHIVLELDADGGRIDARQIQENLDRVGRLDDIGDRRRRGGPPQERGRELATNLGARAIREEILSVRESPQKVQHFRHLRGHTESTSPAASSALFVQSGRRCAIMNCGPFASVGDM